MTGWAFQTRHSGCQSAPWVQIFRSLPWCREDGRGMSGRVRRLFQVLLIFILHLTPHFSFLFLFYFLLNKINNSGKRLLWLVKVFLKSKSQYRVYKSCQGLGGDWNENFWLSSVNSSKRSLNCFRHGTDCWVATETAQWADRVRVGFKSRLARFRLCDDDETCDGSTDRKLDALSSGCYL